MKRTRTVHGKNNQFEFRLLLICRVANDCASNFESNLQNYLLTRLQQPTEAEIIIPLHLRPRRMLACQHQSRVVELQTSAWTNLYWIRLMFGCGEEHMMLDV